MLLCAQMAEAQRVQTACERLMRCRAWRRLLHHLLAAGNAINSHRCVLECACCVDLAKGSVALTQASLWIISARWLCVYVCVLAAGGVGTYQSEPLGLQRSCMRARVRVRASAGSCLFTWNWVVWCLIEQASGSLTPTGGGGGGCQQRGAWCS